MWLYPSIAMENTIQYNNRPRNLSACAKEKKIITLDITAIKKYLIPASIQISRLGSTKCGNIMDNADIIYGDSFACNTDTIYGIKDLDVSCPSIRKSAHGECPVVALAYCH